MTALKELPELDGLNLNLDGLDPDTLTDIAEVLSTLTDYALLKRQAMVERENGLILSAARLENAADDIYKKLPANVRW